MELTNILAAAQALGASDVHLAPDRPPVLRVHGLLQEVGREPLTADLVRQVAEDLVPARLREDLEREGQVDFAFEDPRGGRCRASVFRARGELGVALRLIPGSPPHPDALGVPEAVQELVRRPHGMVIVTGPTGSGKTTTLASLVQEINRERAVHVITLEDPVEYVYPPGRALVRQREIGTDSLSFALGLRAALREDPDVILVGEMRDAETASTALQAAETGHLVFTTLHTADAPGVVDRIVDLFPPHEQQQVLAQLAAVLEGVVAQRLLRRRDGQGRVAAFEVLVATPGVRSLIREGKPHQLVTAMQTGGASGMQTMQDALRRCAPFAEVEAQA